MTDYRKLLIEARAWMVANEKHGTVCPKEVFGQWGRCRCGFVSIIGRIDAALAEKVEPHIDHPMRHYDRTCPACNAALPEGDK